MPPVRQQPRERWEFLARILVMGAFTLGAALACAGQTNVLTYHNDNSRTAQNLNETILTPVNVNSQTFGIVGTIPVDGLVDAEALYVANLTVAGAAHNVLFVVTENDSVYAFDADSFAQLWHVSVIGSGETPSDDFGCGQVTPSIGITSTPVIDKAAGPHGTIFVVGMTKDTSGNYHHRLHALDLTTGAEMSGSPTEITATYTSPQTSAHTTFAPAQYLERTALLLMNGVIYTAWTSHCDFTPYQGWIMGYSESTLQQVSVLNLTPNGTAGAVWMSGEGLAGDSSGNIYFLDGQGTFDDTLNASGFPINGDFGNAFIKLSTAGNSLSVADYFNMHNTDTETLNDQDLGSGGLVLLPDLKDSAGNTWQLAVGAGKDANIYVVNRNSMGKFNTSTDSAIYQEIAGALANGQFAAPAYFNNTFYIGAIMDNLKAFNISNARLSTAASSASPSTFAYPGTSPSISANGTANGIVWAIEKSGTGGGILHAFNAANLSVEYYNSNQAPNGRDNFADNKFVTPMITNGKVYVGTPTNVTVFGLLGTTTVAVPTISPAGGSVTNAQPISISDATSGSTIYFTTNGTTPSITASEQYTGPFTLSQSGTVQAIAVAGASVSSVASATFTVLPPAPTPTISPNGGSIAPSQAITLSDTASGAAIFYTTDGSTPAPGSGTTKSYSAPFTLAGSSTVNVIATAAGFSNSAMASTSFTLQTVPGTAAISVDFVGLGTSPMAASEVAGVVPMPNWNGANGATGSGMTLLDQNGNPTGATVSWTSDDVWNQTITETPGNARMMKGYLDNGQQHTSVVTFTGLPATSSGYTVYVYAQGAATPGSSNTGTYQVSGTGITTSSVALTYTSQFNGTFTQATASNPVGNYVVLTIPAVTSFTLQAIPTAASPSILRAPINGIQLVPLQSTDFSLSASPVSSTVNPGGSTTYTISAAAVNGFSGTVALSASGLPTGATASFSPASIAAGGSSSLTITTTGSTPAASSTITITGTSGTLTHTKTVTLSVSDFSISASPSSVTVSPGGSATYAVSAASLNGFSGTVALSVSGLPAGASASLSPASIATGASSTLTITTTGATLAANSTITITATSGSVTHTKTVTLSVADFTLSASPSSASTAAGSSTTYTVSEAALNGFTGSVALSASGLPTGASSSFSPALITPGTSSTLTITTTGSAAAGTSTLTISGSSGALAHSTTVTLTITASGPPPPPPATGAISIDFVGLGTNPMASSEVAGAVPLSNWNNASGASSTAAMPLVDQNGNATGAAVTWVSDDVWNQSITETAGNARMMNGYLDNGQQHTSIVSVTGLAPNAGGYTVYAYAQGSVSGTMSDTGIYQISGAGITTSSVSLTYTSQFNGTFTQATASNPVGNYVVLTIPNVSAFTLQAIPSASSNGFIRAPINGMQIVPIAAPDFTIAATPSSASTNPGGMATYTISAAAVNGFTGSIALSASGLPTGAGASFNPASISPGGSSTLTIVTSSSTPAGSSTISISGSSGALAHSTSAGLTVTAQNPPPPAAGAISIDFVGLGTNPMASSEVAGVVAVSNWNDANGATGAAMPLVDQNGHATTATVLWTADDVWNQPITDVAGNARMMKGYLDNGQQNTTVVTVSGLPPNAGGYTIYVYAQGTTTTNVNTGIYQISGTGITTQSATLTYNANFNGVFTQATSGSPIGNYVVLTIPNVSAFTLQGIPSTANNPFLRAPINGIQIVPIAGPDFSLSASPSASSVTAGSSATYTVSAAALNGFSGTVTLSASGLPAGAAASFSPGSITPGSNSTLTIATNGSTSPAGSFTLTIGGTSGSLSHSTTVTLAVSAPGDPPPPPTSGVISVDFVGLSTNPMAGSEIAGVVAVGNWNDATGASSSTPLPLMDQNGNPTTATVAWTADDVWNENITDQSGNFRMMRGYLDNGQRNTTVITVAGLPSNANGYSIYVYAQGATSGSTKTATYQISGTGITTTNALLTYNSMFSGTFTQATAANPVGNYVILAIPNATGFTLQGIPGTSTNSAIRAPINGIQIVPR